QRNDTTGATLDRAARCPHARRRARAATMTGAEDIAREHREQAAVALPRAAYRHFLVIPTRWMDNDSYGHVNNVTYYSYFDTAVNEHLICAGGLDIQNAPAIGLVV